MIPQQQLRNIAIVAHVDHGKTTLVDALLRQTKVFRDNQVVQDCVLDSDAIERERGITIFAKNAAIRYDGVKINIIDTPGHADFGGEVERVLRMADGVLLLVDAVDGPMPQTRFVLQKALDAGLKALVVVNKIDRPEARPHDVLDRVFDLFVSLGASDAQLDFPVIYASGRDGYARREPEHTDADVRPLLEAILEHIPAPVVDVDAPAQLQVAAIDYNDYVGRLAIGRLVRGRLHARDAVTVLHRDGTRSQARIEALQVFAGLARERVDEAAAGEIVCITGIPEIGISDTIADPAAPEALPVVKIDEPTLTMEFRPNDSPFLGQDGKYVTSRHVRERLRRELRSNVAMRMEETDEACLVSGRGLLHLGILIENMRREGYEFAVGKPHVIYKTIAGVLHEPAEILTLDVADEALGRAMEILGARKAILLSMENREGGRRYLEFKIPSRGIIGLRGRLLTATRGEAVMHHMFCEYQPTAGEIPGRPNGVMVCTDTGTSTPYAIDSLQQRGVFFIRPGTRVYAGMIVGESARPEDLPVNVCRTKKLTNVRASGASDRNLEIAPPREMSIEAALEYIEEDELLEVTPKTCRLRKRILAESDRRRLERQERG